MFFLVLVSHVELACAPCRTGIRSVLEDKAYSGSPSSPSRRKPLSPKARNDAVQDLDRLAALERLVKGLAVDIAGDWEGLGQCLERMALVAGELDAKVRRLSVGMSTPMMQGQNKPCQG